MGTHLWAHDGIVCTGAPYRCEPLYPAAGLVRSINIARPTPTSMRSKPLVGAVILITLGVLFLLSNLGLLPRLGPLFAQWWPLILIAVGVTMLLRR